MPNVYSSLRMSGVRQGLGMSGIRKIVPEDWRVWKGIQFVSKKSMIWYSLNVESSLQITRAYEVLFTATFHGVMAADPNSSIYRVKGGNSLLLLSFFVCVKKT